MITNNILNRTFYIGIPSKEDKIIGTGTCFSVPLKDREFFITAKHVLEKIADHRKICFYINDKWQSVQIVDIIHRKNTSADVVAFTISHPIAAPNLQIKLGPPISLGQDCYLLGFPETFNTTKTVHKCIEISGSQHPFPIPFAKKTIISKIDMNDQKLMILYIDTIINQGFSGGPLFTIKNNEVTVFWVVVAHFKESMLNAKHSVDEKEVAQPMMYSDISIAHHLPLKELAEYLNNGSI